jgi:hypothetical protein
VKTRSYAYESKSFMYVRIAKLMFKLSKMDLGINQYEQVKGKQQT